MTATRQRGQHGGLQGRRRQRLGRAGAQGRHLSVVGAIGLWLFLKFFIGDSSLAADLGKKVEAEPVEVYDVDGNYVRTEGAPAAGQGSKVKEVIDPYRDLQPGQKYVAQLADKGRVRLAARATINDRERAVVEWVDSSGNTVESLELEQLCELGMTVTGKAFGFELVAGTHTIIATPWPRIIQVRDPDATLYNTSAAGLTPGTAALATVGSEGEQGRADTPYVSATVSYGIRLSDENLAK